MNYIVTTTNITKQYKDTTALNNVSIHIPRGSIYGLVGNNGAGKTTLMRLLLGLQNPTSGQIKIADNIKTGAILETPAVYPYWSAKRNLKYLSIPIEISILFGNSEHPFPERKNMPFRSRVQPFI